MVTKSFNKPPETRLNVPGIPKPQHHGKWKQAGVAVRHGWRSEPWAKEKRSKNSLCILNNSQDLLDKVAELRDFPEVDLSQQHIQSCSAGSK